MFTLEKKPWEWWYSDFLYDHFRYSIFTEYERFAREQTAHRLVDIEEFTNEYEYFYGGATYQDVPELNEIFEGAEVDPFLLYFEYIFKTERLTHTEHFPQKEVW